jgi:glucose-1-phosphate cytidylyltransferase
MKTAILCGGRGTRFGEHGSRTPKGLIGIGGDPILMHLMRHYASFGLREFVLCLGHLGDTIRDHFAKHPLDGCTMEFGETGLDTNTGGRLARVRATLAGEDTFCVTYGDGLADVDLHRLLAFHRAHGKLATVTAVHPYSAFGLLTLTEDDRVLAFREKPRMAEWVNGGFFVFNQGIFEYLTDDCVLEREPFEQLAAAQQLMAFRHPGFWKCMDTSKDHLEFNQLWDAGLAPWHH